MKMCWEFMAFFWMCVIYKNGGGRKNKNKPLLVCLIHERFLYSSKSCVSHSIMTPIGLEVVRGYVLTSHQVAS